jgi:large subunit ribosomal protein L22
MSEVKLIKARLGFVRQTARKVRRTVNLIRDKKVGEAMDYLEFMPYAAAEPVLKLLKSAVANASHNHGVENPQDLYISQFLVDDKSMLKRFRAASRGRAVPILKRTSQLNLVLSEMKPAEYAKHVWDVSPRNKKNQKKKEVKEVK